MQVTKGILARCKRNARWDCGYGPVVVLVMVVVEEDVSGVEVDLVLEGVGGWW